jgi:hypothetical protein
MLQALSGLSATSGYLRHCEVPPELKESLTKATHNRAVLLTEISDFILTEHFGANALQVRALSAVKRQISFECVKQLDVVGRHYPIILPKLHTQNVEEAFYSIRPRHWTWAEAVAAGAIPSAIQLALVLECIYAEHVPLAINNNNSNLNGPHPLYFHSFKARCEASGMMNLIPTVNPEAEREARATGAAVTHRQKRGFPLDRIKEKPKRNTSIPSCAWRFTGHLELENVVRLALGTLPGSWTSTASEWRVFGQFMNKHHEGVPHFPIRQTHLAAFINFFDNFDSCKKYLLSLRKAHTVLNLAMPPQPITKMIKAGASKHHAQGPKSYVRGSQVSSMAFECARQGRSDLAQFICVIYTFQLRVESEAVNLSVTLNKTGFWESHVVANDDGSVTLKFRKRKNNPNPSSIKRFCICAAWGEHQVVCGVCPLKKLLLQAGNEQGRLFPRVRKNDIKLLKKISHDLELSFVTWHGFRRGRTEDIVQGLDVKNNPAASLREIAVSLGHKNPAMFSYVTDNTADKRRTVRQICDDTDSE